MRSVWPYLVSILGGYLMVKAAQENPLNPLTIGAILPLIMVGPTAKADQVVRRLSEAGKALTRNGDGAENGV